MLELIKNGQIKLNNLKYAKLFIKYVYIIRVSMKPKKFCFIKNLMM